MPLLVSRRKRHSHLGQRVALRDGVVYLGASVRRWLGSDLALVAYDAKRRVLALIGASPAEKDVAYVVDRRGRVHCLNALREFGLEDLRGVFPVVFEERGRIEVKIR